VEGLMMKGQESRARGKSAARSTLTIVGVMLERRQVDQLDALAARDRRSRSCMLRVIVDEALAGRAAS
jgi:hypothetical protein